MLTLLFIIIMISVFGKFLALALRGAWGITKIFFGLIFMPIILVGLVLGNLFVLAIPILLVMGIIALVAEA